MHWHSVTAIYIIGNRYPMAVFANEKHATEWAEREYPGEWVSKPVKIPPMPLTSKSAQRDLKSMAALLENMEWDSQEDEHEPESSRILHHDQG